MGSAFNKFPDGSVDGVAVTGIPTIGQTVVATSPTAATWQTPASGGGSGTVTTLSVVSANGFAGTVATPTTTPAITLTTTVTGLLKGNGTATSGAVAGTDYALPNANTTGTASNITGTLAVSQGGTGATATTGSGNNVLSTSPTLVTPALGTPSALVLTNATGLPIAGLSATGTPSSTTFLRGDNTWSAPAGGGGGDMLLGTAQTVTAAKTFNAGTLLDKGESHFDVKAYGAKGDGSTFDSTAINAAIAACNTAGGGTVFFSAGTFIIDATLTMFTNVSLRGSGRRATRLFKNAGGYNVITVAGTAGANLEKMTFQDMTIEGNAQTGFGFGLQFAQLMNFNNITVDGFLDSAVDAKSIQDSYFHQFTANTDHHATHPVMNFYGSSGWSTNMIWFSQVRIEDFWGTALSVTQGTGYTGVNNGFFFTDCKFESTNVAGDICVFDSSSQEVHMDHIFLSAGGFKAGYSTPVAGINFGGTLINSFEEIFMNGATGTVNSVLKVVSASGSIVIDNLSTNVTPSVATVNFNGASGATYTIGQLSGSTPFIGGTATVNSILTDTTILGKTTTTTLKIGSSSTTGYIWTATDAIGNGSWQVAPVSGSGITRNISTVTTALTLGATALVDYVAFIGSGGAPTLPTAVSNTNKYTIKNIHTTNKTLATTSAQTIDGTTTITIAPNNAVDVVSNGSNWQII
jgi:hypothetical protein